jgi:PST family polysaccharide transporter
LEPSVTSPADDLRHRTITGIAWSLLAQVSEQSLRFVIAVILARLLSPEEFGLLGMVTVFTGFATLFSTIGFGTAIIQKQDIQQRHLCSVFWIGAASGMIITVIISACSPLIAYFYGQQVLIPITIAISFNFIIGSLNGVQNSLFIKNMDFRRLGIVRVGAIAIAGVVAVIMALSGFGVWSLVANSLILTTVNTILLWQLSSWRPKFQFDFQAIRDLWGFSLNLMGARVCWYWTSNIDNLLIGRFLGSFALGIYSRAYSLMLLPINQLSTVLDRVMFPALASIQSEKERVKDTVLRANRAIAFLGFPMMMGLLITAESFILAIYGKKWEAVIGILQILCLRGLRSSVGTSVGWLYLSQGRTDLMFKFSIFSGIVTFVAVLIGLQWGAIGVASAIVLAGYIVLWYPSITIPGRLVDLSFREVLRNVASISFCSLGMSAVVFAAGYLMPEMWPHWRKLLAQTLLGVAVYSALVICFRVPAYIETKELIMEALKKRKY